MKKIVYKGHPTVRKLLAYQMKNTKWNVCVTTYEYVIRDKNVLSKYHWEYIIIDEGQRMKNSRCKFAQILG